MYQHLKTGGRGVVCIYCIFFMQDTTSHCDTQKLLWLWLCWVSQLFYNHIFHTHIVMKSCETLRKVVKTPLRIEPFGLCFFFRSYTKIVHSFSFVLSINRPFFFVQYGFIHAGLWESSVVHKKKDKFL